MTEKAVEPREALRRFLGGIPIFGGLSDEGLDRVSAMLGESSYSGGAYVCREGEPGSAMYVVAEGEVVVCRRTPEGRQVRVVRLGRGELFGEMTLIEIQPRSASVLVESNARLYSLTKKDLYRLYREDLHSYVIVLQNIARELARRLRRADERICQMAEAADDVEETQIGRP